MTGYQRAQMNHTISVTFTSSGTYTFIENSTVTQGNWKIQMIGMNYFGVDSTLFETVIDKPIYYLSGLVLPCGNQLMLDDSYGDGCSNLFQKQ